MEAPLIHHVKESIPSVAIREREPLEIWNSADSPTLFHITGSGTEPGVGG
jgi:hypothetical protein